MIADARHGHLDHVGGEPREFQPPRGGEPGRGCLRPEPPYSRTNASSIGEWPVGNEEHPTRASPPNTALHTTVNRKLAEATPDGLIERDYAVMAAQQIREHSVQTVISRPTVPSLAI
jgi:hypothetical protein